MALYFLRVKGQVKGPYPEEKLQELALKGQLSQAHEVSEDGANWSPAGRYPQLFPARRTAAAPQPSPAATEVNAASGFAPASSSGATKSPETPHSPPSAADWYYAVDNQRSGPVPFHVLSQLLSEHSITPETMVWSQQLADWMPASEVPLLAMAAARPIAVKARPRRRWSVLLVSIAALLGLGGIAGYAYWRLSPKPYITSSSDPRLEQAVPFVLTGVEIGTGKETRFIPINQGTAFCVSPDGLLFTNRHVTAVDQKFTDELQKALGGKVEITPAYRVLVGTEFAKATLALESKSENCDFACLKVSSKKPLPYFRLAASSLPAKQSAVIALGYPGVQHEQHDAQAAKQQLETGLKTALETSFDHYIGAMNETAGNVSNVLDQEGIYWIIHQADISGGNSGGPLIDADGCVVGINTKYEFLGKDGRPTPGNFYALWIGEVKGMVERRFRDVVGWK